MRISDWSSACALPIFAGEPGAMTLQRVGPRVFICRETVVDVPPMVGRGVGGVDAQRVHGVDSLAHALDLGPAVDEQPNLAAGGDARPGLIGFARKARAQDAGGDTHRSHTGEPTTDP